MLRDKSRTGTHLGKLTKLRPITNFINMLMRKLLISLTLIVLLTMCAFNFITSPLVLCLMDGGCTHVTFTSAKGIYPRVVAITCFVSYSTLIHKYYMTMSVYEKNIRAHDVYSPATASECRKRTFFCSFCIALCLSVMLPVNLLRLWTMYKQNADFTVLVFFVFMYTENIGIYLVEMYFVTLCYTLDEKFSKINRDLERLGEEIVNPIAVLMEKTRITATGRVTYDRDFYGTWSREHSVANAVEILRIRHQLIRDAVYVLIDIFGVPMGMSLFSLCVMMLFDIYYQVFRVMGAESRSLFYIYMWLLQYSIRFYLIVVTAHNTTKQVNSYTVYNIL